MAFPPPEKKEKKRFGPPPTAHPAGLAPAVPGSVPASALPLLPARPRPVRPTVLSAAEVYARCWQVHDARYLAQHAEHEGQSLESLTKQRYPKGYWRKTTKPTVMMAPYPGIFVRPEFKFSQANITGVGNGICQALSMEFMNFRRLGFGVAQILAIFRTPDFAREFVALHKQLKPSMFDSGSVVGLQSQALQKAEEALRKQSLLARKSDAPPATPFVRRCLPYLQLTGQFEIDPALPLSRSVGTVFGTFPCCDRPLSTVRHHARGVYISWDGSSLFQPLPQTADASQLHIGQHLFENMQRNCTERTVYGSLKDESLPFFSLVLGQRENHRCAAPIMRNSHSIVVEFNVVDGQLTTPRGIFDPNFGWMEPERGFCSLDFDMAIQSLFHLYASRPPFSAAPSGMIFALQYHSASNGVSNDAEYVRKWGGLPWTNYRPDAKGGK